MSKENKDQQIDQLLRGVYRMCVNRDDCTDCPFYITKCTFEEPKPSTWFDEETIEVQKAPVIEDPVIEEETVKAEEAAPEASPEVAAEPAPEAAPEGIGMQKEDDDSDATWLVSTTMGSVFTKYVFICSKCGYKKESMFSITPMTFCPECEKRKNGQA